MRSLILAALLAAFLCACATQPPHTPVAPAGVKPAAPAAQPQGYLFSNQSAFKLALYSNEELLEIQGAPGQEVPLKPGIYVVAFLEFTANDGASTWKLSMQGKAGEIKIEPGQKLELPFGPPLKATLQAAKAHGAVKFQPMLSGRGGETYPVYALRNGDQPVSAPRIEIRKPDGALLASGEFKYG